MAELYHLHLKGIRDDKWKEKKEIVITDNFINRLGKKVNNFNDCTNNPRLYNITSKLNNLLQQLNYHEFSKMPLHLILDYVLDPNTHIDQKTQKIVLQEMRNLAFETAILKRETAMESYRKDNKNNLPSRQHCLYATTESGIEYWKYKLLDGDIDIFRIETLEEPFKTSEILIPGESGTYEEIYNNSFKYWNPKLKNVPDETSEYLVKGKIKILEKVDEIKS